MDSETSLSYILHHMDEDNLPGNAVSPPIFQTSIFCFPTFAEFRDAINDEVNHSLYTRGNNPTVMLAEKKLAALEGAERAKLVSSGVAAISHSVMAFVKSGDHVVCVEDCYSWTRTLLSTYLARFGVSVTYVEGTDPGEVIAAVRPETKVIYLESPTTLTFKLQDLPAIAAEARKRGIKTMVDNTWATPIFCNPISMGIDLVIHSGSKYFGGASDIIAGVIAGSKEDIDLIQEQEFLQLGTVADPFMAWLLLRGLRTLHIRMKAHYEGALAAARYLESHPKVESVLYPMLDSYGQAALSQKLFRGGSGLFSIQLKTKDIRDVIKFTDRLRLFKRAVSWGGYESLVFPNAVKYQNPAEIPPDRLGLVRLHIGLEKPEELMDDLSRALGTIS
ncbi:aminotransferase class I/II-fold pyridoxal phosphate-dependent enzyme [Breznakiella homolactica]|uniref:Aminotransferase class I/II-fold pyridoxal phosphate-dependent enzyme n=1 Tax=Breznakiella homolactica TaxID=2798577 RepID=A0A7T7XND7_9SPIR|nr:aminotransferase class I/II-fold pyridoxal phosphate-dependent enzyme [Breznakiella homolactica]QQO09488.1 aminotransferase class I/II-fold pyridoxal phosphate-dependent enzyme [Breznakiella homolactica]